MRKLFVILSLQLGITGSIAAQSIVVNHCDSLLLTKEQFDKCKQDSVFTGDIIARSNYLILLKTSILPKYRKAIPELPEGLLSRIRLCRHIYDSTYADKRKVMLADVDRHQDFVQPRNYITATLALEAFAVYPDVYSLLLNPIVADLRPKTSKAALLANGQLIESLYAAIPQALRKELIDISQDLEKDKEELVKRIAVRPVLQGDISAEEKIKYQVVNLLLWMQFPSPQ